MEHEEKLHNLRHSVAHLLAAAVMDLWPDTKRTIGPSIENGFYFDFSFSKPISEDELPKIEKKMREILPTWETFSREEVTPEEAKKRFAGNEFKIELIDEFSGEGEKISFYKSGKYEDLCRGGHIENMKNVDPKSFALTKVAGAYWRGDEKNPMLTRIYGTAFETAKELRTHLAILEEAKKRDHRKLGAEMDLFVFSDIVGPGMPIYTPKGSAIRREIVNFSEELQKSIGYQQVHTPNMNKAELFKLSGHYDKFKDNMFLVKSNYSNEEYYLKPMNCPMHTQIFAAKMRSYKDLPLRYSDFANLYRDEKPGELHGLLRLRCFSQDDGHAFCREDQLEAEFTSALSIIKTALKAYDMKYYVRLSLRDEEKKENYIGSDEDWKMAQDLLEKILIDQKIEYRKVEGEAAFYGPKMDIMTKDSLGREWQISTIQLDPNMPKRFGLEYIDRDGRKKSPIMIHRALIGSPERFMSILIEHFAGAFPTWLAPVQVILVAVSDSFNEFTSMLQKELEQKNIRVEADVSSETVGNKIRKATKAKAPYILVVGEKEQGGGALSIRKRGQKETEEMSKDNFISHISKEISERR